MRKISKRELILTVATILILVLAVVYTHVFEAHVKSSFVSDNVYSRYREYFRLFDNRDEIEKEAKKIFSSTYWKENTGKQQIALQSKIEKIARVSGITNIRSIYPLQTQKIGQHDEILVELDIECSLSSLNRFLYGIGVSEIPLNIRKLHISSEAGAGTLVRGQIAIASLFFENKGE